MGVEMKVYVVPRSNPFRPDATALTRFVEELRQNSWVADPGQPWFRSLPFATMKHHKVAAATGGYIQRRASLKAADRYAPLPVTASELVKVFADAEEGDRIVGWPVEQQGQTPLRYPLNVPSPCSPEDTYYNIELWLSDDFVYNSSETIEPLDSDTCNCGASLDYDPEDGTEELFHAPRLRRSCAACGRLFDPSLRSAIWNHPGTGERCSLPGGATFRFALVIDCGKCWPRPPAFGVHPDLRALCERSFGLPFYDVLDVY